ncbi:hypothetical protein GQ457_08G033210 [Hibiscus cannabinus]
MSTGRNRSIESLMGEGKGKNSLNSPLDFSIEFTPAFYLMNDSPCELGYCSQNFVSVLISIGVRLLLVPLAVVFCAGTGDVRPRALSLVVIPLVLHRYLLHFRLCGLCRRLWVAHVSYDCLSLLGLTPEFMERSFTTLPNSGIRAVLGSGHGYGPFPFKGGLRHNRISIPQIKLSWFKSMLRDPPWAWFTLLLLCTHVSWIIGIRLAHGSSFFGHVDASWSAHAASPLYHVCCSPREICICPWIFWVIILGLVLHIRPVYFAFWAQHHLLIGRFLLLGHLLFSVAWTFVARPDPYISASWIVCLWNRDLSPTTPWAVGFLGQVLKLIIKHYTASSHNWAAIGSSAFVWDPTGYTWSFAAILYLISSLGWSLARYYVYGPEFFATCTTFGITTFMAFIVGLLPWWSLLYLMDGAQGFFLLNFCVSNFSPCLPLMDPKLIYSMENLQFTEAESGSVVTETPCNVEDSGLRLVRSIITNKAVNEDSFYRIFRSVWKSKNVSEILELCPNFFMIKPVSEEAKNMNLKRRPWVVHEDLFSLELYNPMWRAANFDFNNMVIWIRVYLLPLQAMNITMGLQLGGCIGKVISMDHRVEGGNLGEFLRIRVALDITKPLQLCVLLGNGHSRKPTPCLLKYERLPRFCYFCGLLGHDLAACLSKRVEYDARKL